ncbi:signal transduction histidine kinase [Marinobacterium halophilum]|uniref:histidine kinase n=1 Tax=Marinobacterium halophilum TaxID=267374 RepID=A0A2P8EWM3_9GAMM|nr:HAMP domain-containing sensor histidine kinase [Marinobacterium halophilum]PSL13867.1 signal transduction histidine kinase [Marinobacterium halophilum]
MRVYQGLYWKMFLVIWLVSLAGMSSVYLLLNSRLDSAHKLEVLEARAQGQARLMLERYEQQDPEWKRADGGRHRLRIWLYSADGAEQLTHWRRPPPEPTLDFELTTASGRVYQARVPLPRDERHAEHLLERLFSLQMVLILLVSALSGGVLSALVVRPIRRLSDHVRDLHEHRDLSLRADRRLSARRDEIGELTREFDRMADYVEQTLSARQQLLQDVSHELRAPLARLQAAAGLLEQRLTRDDPLLQRIERECDRLNSLIGEILAYSRAGQQAVTDESFTLQGVADELMADLRLRQPERPFSVQLEDEGLCYPRGRSQLLCALQNGIENAVRHTDPGVALTLSIRRLADAVELRLRDYGPGVAPDLLTQLFTPFVRGQAASADGFGLGMSIALNAIDQLGGQVDAHNHPQGGLELIIRLPLD